MIYRRYCIIFLCFIAYVPYAFAQEDTGSLEIYIKNESQDRVVPNELSIKIFKDLDKKPLVEIPSLVNNPVSVSSLPLNHKYKVEVYMNGMFADTRFVDLQKSNSLIEIPIKNTGGMRLNIFHSDGETPLQSAQVWIRSNDGKIQSYSDTDTNGKTITSWLYPTVKKENHYYAEILLAPGIKYVHSPLTLQPDIVQDFKIVTKWPTIVDKLITVEVYNSTKTKVTKQDGEFIAQLFDIKNNKIAESKVTDKGLAHFSKLKVGNYALHIKANDVEQLRPAVTKKVTITDTTDIIKIYVNNPDLNSEHLNCNCVAFRLDDIQDFYLAPAQIQIISLFKEKNIPLTLGVIGGTIGTDQKLILAIKNSLDESLLEIANHSWRHGIYSKMTKSAQEDDLKRTNKKISEVFGVAPTTFIPPENSFNNDTLSILKANNFTHISYGELGPLAEPPKFVKSDFYHFPMYAYTAKLDSEKTFWTPTSADQTVAQIDASLFNYGYAVVMLHPMEFSIYDGGYTNSINMTKIQELDSLIDSIQSKNLKILPINSIQDFDKPQISKPTTESEPPNCNCVAFRLDNIQDFWLNDVQNTAIDTFTQNKIPLTITIIGKFLGDDPKVVSFIKGKLDNNTQIQIASRGWEYIDHTAYDKENQKASINQTNEKIKKLFGKNAILFSPPFDTFNSVTMDAAKEAGVIYFSANVEKDSVLQQDTLTHIPSSVAFSNLIDDDPFYSGTISQKALAKIQASIKQYGYAVISLQPSDLAVKTDVFKNRVDSGKMQLLKEIISHIKSNQIKIVSVESIPDQLIPKPSNTS